MVTSLPDQDKHRVRKAISIFNIMNKLGVLNTTDITAANTVEGIRLLFVNANIHEEFVKERRSAVESLDEMQKLTGLADADILGLTTYATFLALFTGLDPALDDASKLLGDVNYSGNSSISRKTIN